LTEPIALASRRMEAHVVPLGLAFSERHALPAPFIRGMFIGQHGSWNRRPRSGYNVVIVPFTGGAPAVPRSSSLPAS
jgi:glucose/arabinose dehydrogenase